VSDRDEAYMASLLADVREGVRLSREARKTYRARVDQHIEKGATVGRTRVESEVRASTDAIVRGAASDNEFYDRCTIAAGIAFLAEVFSVEIESEAE
jgi:hypothetical protein